ncbi:MAG: tetrahydromethanopterin S-methyltransferase subunit A [Nitrosopumilales archaeon]|nr:MAG: tetrahydromethanopterin S-methyltransferase subunit A [Nitrosopumilales archaeon]
MIYEKMENCISEICKYLLPIKHEHFVGKGSRIAICTLSSIRLLTEISNDTKLMNNLAIVGRLLSENKGIDDIINYCIVHKELEHLILCGKDSRGHRAGDSLIALSKNGMTKEGMIIKSKSPRPQLLSSYQEVEIFRDRVTVHNMIEENDLNRIRSYVDEIIQ